MKSYWDEYYKTNAKPFKPSSFAKFVLTYLKEKESLLELGCGNGRDSIFFNKNKIDVVGIDSCSSEIDFLIKKYSNDKLKFSKSDFTCFKSRKKFDNIYSRFTLHTITEKEENKVIQLSKANLKKHGNFFIEARTTNDIIYGKGKNVGTDEFITSHYRRFLNSSKFIKKMLRNGFKLLYFIESNDLSILKNDNPVLLRIVCKNDY